MIGVRFRAMGVLVAVLLFPAGGGVLVAQDAPRAPTGTAVLLGTVVGDESEQAVAATSVEIRSAADSALIRQVTTSQDGRFRAERLPEGVFFVRLTNLGYATTTTQSFELAAGETRDLGPLRVSVQAFSLEAIQVSTERTSVTFEADRTSYNLGVMGGFEGASVTESLRSIPELEVGIDGQITVRGSAPVVYINGRPAPMTGEALAAFLEQFPADYLERIEVIDNPSARFDAEGSGGVVNLVLKEGVDLGVSGSIFANAGTRGQYGIGGRATAQRGDWTLTGGGFGRLSDAETTDYDLRQNLVASPPYQRQDGSSDRTGLSSNVDLSARFEPTEAMRFSARGRVSGSGNEMTGFTTTTHLDEVEAPILEFGRVSELESRSLSVDVSAGFDYTWEPRAHELESRSRRSAAGSAPIDARRSRRALLPTPAACSSPRTHARRAERVRELDPAQRRLHASVRRLGEGRIRRAHGVGVERR